MRYGRLSELKPGEAHLALPRQVFATPAERVSGTLPRQPHSPHKDGPVVSVTAESTSGPLTGAVELLAAPGVAGNITRGNCPSGQLAAGLNLSLRTSRRQGTPRPQAAHGLYSRHKPPRGAEGEFVVQYARNASLLRFIPPKTECPGVGACQPESRRSGGGRRGVVGGFSRRSRKRLLEWFNSIDQRRVSFKQVWFIGLTYPETCRPSLLNSRRHLDALRKRLVRRWGPWGITWKLEPQKNGSPHWHLLAIVPRKQAHELREFRKWLAQAWYEVCQTGCPAHRYSGTSVSRGRSRSNALLVLARYTAKITLPFIDPSTGAILPVGRCWGIWNRRQVPIQMMTVRLSWQQFQCFQRRVCSHLHWRVHRRLTVQTIFLAERHTLALLGEVRRLQSGRPRGRCRVQSGSRLRPGLITLPISAFLRRRQRSLTCWGAGPLLCFLVLAHRMSPLVSTKRPEDDLDPWGTHWARGPP